MARPLTSLFAFLSIAAVSLSFLGSVCDLSSDDCNEPEDNHCSADNHALTCTRPSPEVHRILIDVACTGGTVCMMGSDRYPFCERPGSTCPTLNAMTCENDTFSRCVTDPDGGLVLSESHCPSGPTCQGGYGACLEVVAP